MKITHPRACLLWRAGKVLQDRKKGTSSPNVLQKQSPNEKVCFNSSSSPHFFLSLAPAFAFSVSPFTSEQEEPHSAAGRKDVPNACLNPFHTTAVSVSNSQMTVTQKKKLPILNSGILKTFNSYQDSLSHFFRFLYWETKSTASTDIEAQLTTVGWEQASFTIEEPEANFFCLHTASTLPRWVGHSFLKGLFLLLRTCGTKIWSDRSTKRIHTSLATKPRDDMPGQVTKEESSFQCCFWALQPHGSYHLC